MKNQLQQIEAMNGGDGGGLVEALFAKQVELTDSDESSPPVFRMNLQNLQELQQSAQKSAE